MKLSEIPELNELHGFQPSPVIKQREDVTDRMILLLKAQGCTNRQIARTLNIAESTVSHTVRQPWFVKKLLSLVHSKAEDAVDKALELATKDAVEVAYQIMMDEQASARLRAECAFNFIKASRGTKVVVQKEDTMSLSELREQAKRLEEEIADLEGRAGAV